MATGLGLPGPSVRRGSSSVSYPETPDLQGEALAALAMSGIEALS